VKKKFRLLGWLAVFSLFVVSAPAQSRIDNRGKCSGPIYNARDVTRRAQIRGQPDFRVIYEAFGRDVHARVSLDAVLCRSGQVTDIRVVESAPPNVGEFVAAAVSLIRFAPAELNWHTVSQRQKFEFSINDSGFFEEIDPATAAGRLLERLEIVGYRRMTAEQIRSWVKTRAGEPYDSDQIQRDLKAILATGYFNSSSTRVHTEDGVRGGVGVIFEVVELPLIKEMNFRGLKIDPSVLLQALDKELNLRTGVPFGVEASKKALALIKRVLTSNGQRASKVDLQTELVNATTINLTFVITND
jgi:hypothetical protein